MRLQSQSTNHQARTLPVQTRFTRSLTFILISVILLCSVADVLAEDGRTNTYIRMEETEIIGVIEHPEITYIIPKTRIRFNPIPLERDFSGRALRLKNYLDLEAEIRVNSLLGGP